MKQTPLIRKTPLRRSAKPMKRSAIRSKPRPAADRVDGALHAHVINRDRVCIGILLRERYPELRDVIPWHQCATQYGDRHAADNVLLLTVDHFHHHAGGTKGDRAPSDAEHLVACCGWLNVNHITRAIREGERRYMAELVASGRA